MTSAAMDRRRVGAWAGMIGSALFVAVFTLEGFLRPGYNMLSMFISELSLGPRGWIQIANFVILGVLFLIFTWGIAAEFREGKASRFGPILLALVGVGFLVSGPFVMDPASTPRTDWSVHGTLHQLFGALVFSLSPITCFVFWRRFREDPAWRSLHVWTFVVGVVMVIAVILLKLPAQPPASPNAFNPWMGLIQRFVIVPYMAWIFTVALRLLRRSQAG